MPNAMMYVVNAIFVFLTLILPPHAWAGFEDQSKPSESKKADKEIEQATRVRSLVGQRFYALFPRESCTLFGIKSQATLDRTQIYTSDTPQQLSIEGIVEITIARSTVVPFLKVKLEDGSIGYTQGTAALYTLIGDPDNEKSLAEKCWFQITPEEVQSRLHRIKSDLTSQAPAKLKKLDKEDFCIAYGQALRGESITDFGSGPDLANLVKAEARRRKYAFNESDTKKQEIKTGMSLCQLYASWGYSNTQNRTVGSWGTHIQHVYGNQYVYTENGRVTSWQD